MLGSSMNPNLRNFALWAIIALLLIALFSMFQTAPAQTGSREIPLFAVSA
ncbi:accessory gene regulator protein AgrB [Rhizobium leguminosarum]